MVWRAKGELHLRYGKGIRRREKRQDLIKRGYALAGGSREKVTVKRFAIEFGDAAMPIGRPVDRRVMDDNELSVPRCTYVKFDGPIAAGKRAAKGHQAVLRPHPCPATVRDDQRSLETGPAGRAERPDIRQRGWHCRTSPLVGPMAATGPFAILKMNGRSGTVNGRGCGS